MLNKPVIATLGGHSALEICLGAKKLGFKTLVIVQKGREKTYTHYYRNLIDYPLTVDSFKELTSKEVIIALKKKNCIFIPHRYIQVYCDLDKLEKSFPIPIFGNKYLLKYEERTGKFNQYQLLEKAQIDYPKHFKKAEDIDRLVIVKVKEAIRGYERAFFFARDLTEYRKKAEQLINNGKIKREDLKSAVIEEYLIGAQVNFNFFYSPLDNFLQLLGTDIRRQTNIDGLIRLPTWQQQEVRDDVIPSYIESGHIAVTVKESTLEKAFDLAEKLVKAAKKIVAPGIIGPFALQTAVIPGPPKEKIMVYDLSLRIPGSPGTSFTPYSQYHFGEAISFGRRIAMEIEKAIKVKKITKIIT
jgi:5-formaminoimidazole-4-carboxamide-1-(beta)-D-ribofuranosyl 5'-monophosphate synthetase